MIYFPETIDTISTVSPIYLPTFFLSYARELTLCMLASWSLEGVVFLDLLPSPHYVTSFLFPCLGSTDALCPRSGDPVLLPPKWRPYSQGPRTLPYRDPEHLLLQFLSKTHLHFKIHFWHQNSTFSKISIISLYIWLLKLCIFKIKISHIN
jgi:hypothetical protein